MGASRLRVKHLGCFSAYTVTDVSTNVVGLAVAKVKDKGHPITCHEDTERE